jgi:hypothetical protein
MRSAGFFCLWLFFTQAAFGQSKLIGHWPLQETVTDLSENHWKSTGTGIRFETDGPTAKLAKSAAFDGITSVIEVTEVKGLRMSREPFTVAAWIRAEETSDDVPGDIVSQYDPQSRTGFHLGLYSHMGVTNSQSNLRQLHFGIDQGHLESGFTDHGQPGSAVFVFSLCVHDGRLYASTCHAGAEEAGHVYRYEEGDRWTDLGTPDKANSISAMTVFNGALYAASGKYRLAGSSLAESTNPNFGGGVFRLGPDDQWISCGRLSPDTEAVASLIEYRGQLYASSLYKPAGFYRYAGGETWTACSTPNGKRVEAMAVFNGFLYATSYDEGAVFRFDGDSWETVGLIPGATQTYGLAVHEGRLFVSEWPQAHVFRYLGDTNWEDVGKLGEELEAMPLLVYNGKMFGGTLPTAEVYRYERPNNWTRIGRVDHTPDVKYRRAWSMAVYKGRLFVGTLPSGRVLSIEAGRNATFDHAFPSGWHHVAAIRDVNQLRLFIDGQQVSSSAVFNGQEFDLSGEQPLRIGFGAQDHFQGRMADLRVYRGTLTEEELRQLVNSDR